MVHPLELYDTVSPASFIHFFACLEYLFSLSMLSLFFSKSELISFLNSMSILYKSFFSSTSSSTSLKAFTEYYRVAS